jgi:hypothetical protein
MGFVKPICLLEGKFMSLRNKIVATVASAAAVLGLAAATAAPASAAGKDGVINSGEVVLYYLSNFGYPILDLYVSDANFADDILRPNGYSADNNTESVWNNDTYYWNLYPGANYTGSCGYVAPGVSGNLAATWFNATTSARYTSTACP